MPRSVSGLVKNIMNRKLAPLKEVVYPNEQCLPGARWPTVTTEGNIIICDAVGYNKDLSIGNVKDGWNLKTITSVIDNYIDASQTCLTCWVIRLCPFCIKSSLDEKGQICHSAKEIRCEKIKSEYELAFQEYLRLLAYDKKVFDYIGDLNSNEQN